MAVTRNILKEKSVIFLLGIMKEGVLVVAYNAEKTVVPVISRISKKDMARITEIVIFDDCSRDKTSNVANEFKKKKNLEKIKIFRNSRNLRYGGNEKRGYNYFLERGFDLVVLLHGDGLFFGKIDDK